MGAERRKIVVKRAERGWTQEDLSKRTKLTQSTISRIERGHPCTSSALDKIAAAFGCPVGDLL